MTSLSRRRFLHVSAGVTATALSRSIVAQTTQSQSDGFYTVGRRNNRWWIITPDREPMFSLGLNHIDPASLRYAENNQIWFDRYGNDIHRWLTESVRRNLLSWGFNTVGWNQEVVTRNAQNHRHSRSFTYEEYQSLNMPYCHMLPFSEIHQWDVETRQPDFLSSGFAEWCDYVARDHCARLRDDTKLVGYWYSDCPMWVHVRRDNQWRGPLFDPERLQSESGRSELTDLASAYYRTTREAIRRYDPNHLILGDRYEANAPLPQEVVRAALDHVDVLSFQCFGSPEHVQQKLSQWTPFEKPMILADHAISRKPAEDDRYHDPSGYAKTLQVLTGMPEVVGYHLCGAYSRNRVRRRGLLDELERPDTIAINGIRSANGQVTEWVKTASVEP